mmetsp:Transcript_99339/g.303757  ORF Transcript_99339/g.303757 Transcript_99339/m.303757 type:complete len:380 (-) Transcript_99339:317-1456(-)
MGFLFDDAEKIVIEIRELLRINHRSVGHVTFERVHRLARFGAKSTDVPTFERHAMVPVTAAREQLEEVVRVAHVARHTAMRRHDVRAVTQRHRRAGQDTQRLRPFQVVPSEVPPRESLLVQLVVEYPGGQRGRVAAGRRAAERLDDVAPVNKKPAAHERKTHRPGPGHLVLPGMQHELPAFGVHPRRQAQAAAPDELEVRVELAGLDVLLGQALGPRPPLLSRVGKGHRNHSFPPASRLEAQAFTGMRREGAREQREDLVEVRQGPDSFLVLARRTWLDDAGLPGAADAEEVGRELGLRARKVGQRPGLLQGGRARDFVRGQLHHAPALLLEDLQHVDRHLHELLGGARLAWGRRGPRQVEATALRRGRGPPPEALLLN